MNTLRRLAVAAAVAGVMAAGIPIATARVEAAGKKDGGNAQTATCEYLLNVINYPYVSPSIRLWAISLYNSYGC